jgi:hypothetical protein
MAEVAEESSERAVLTKDSTGEDASVALGAPTSGTGCLLGTSGSATGLVSVLRDVLEASKAFSRSGPRVEASAASAAPLALLDGSSSIGGSESF